MKAPFGGSSGDLNADRRYGLAMQLIEWKDLQAAADLLGDCAALTPNWPPIHFHLGDTLIRLGQAAQAEESFQAYLRLDPADIMGAGIKLALIGRYAPEAAMSRDYVASLFDQYAPYFESALVGRLDYHAPEQMAQMLPRPIYDRMLDIGCGTGLGATAMTGRARHMTGIDVAPGMIAQAKQKKLYDGLHISSIDEYMQQTSDMFDLVFSADVFVYIGPLEEIFLCVAEHLLPSGHFIMSLQDAVGDAWILGNDHRYAHNLSYIERCAAACGLTVRHHESIALRLDQGRSIPGRIVLCEKS